MATFQELMREMIAKLPTRDEVRATEKATPRDQIMPRVVVKKEKKAKKEASDLDFRKQVRERDKHRSRACGLSVSPTALDWDHRAEVHHRLKRSTHPDERLNVGNGITLTKTEHKLAETRCPNLVEHYMLEITGPDDLGEEQLFTWRSAQGVVTKTRQG